MAVVSVGTLEALLRLRDELSPALKIANQNIQQTAAQFSSKLNPAMTSAAGLADKASNSFLKIGAVATAAGAAVASAFVASSAKAAEYEAALTKISALTDVQPALVERWRKELLELGGATGKGPQEVGKGLYYVASAGFKTAEALEIAKTAAEASSVGMGETETIARALTAAMNAWGKEGLTTKQAIDILTQTVVSGSAEADGYASSLGRVIPIAATLGVSFAEVGAFLAIFTRQGVNANEAVTSLRGVLSALAAPGKQAQEALQKAGTSVEELQKSIKENGLQQTLDELVQKFHGNYLELDKVIPNIRALTGVMATAGTQGKAYAEELDKIKNSHGRFDKALEETKKTLQFQWNAIKGDLEAIVIKFGTAVLPLAKQLLEALKPVVDFLAYLAKMISDLDPVTQKWLLGFVFAIGPANTAIGLMLKLIAQAILGFKTVGAVSFSPAVVSVRILATALGTVTAAVLTFMAAWKLTRALIEDTWVERNLDQSADWLVKAWQGRTKTNAEMEQGRPSPYTLANGGSNWNLAPPPKEQDGLAFTEKYMPKSGKSGSIFSGPVVDPEAQKRAADAIKRAREEFDKLVESYRKNNSEAGINAERTKNINAILAALGPTAKASSAEIVRASTALKQFGDDGAVSASRIKKEWEDANGEMILLTRSMEVFTPTIDNTTKGYLTQEQAMEQAKKAADDLNRSQQDHNQTQAAFAKLLADGKITYEQYIKLGGEEKVKKEEATKATFSYSRALEDLKNTFQLLGIEADSALMKAVVGLQSGLAAAQSVRKILTGSDGKPISFIDADKTQKGQIALQALNTAMVAYSGNALSGAAAGAAFGASFGPIGAAIGGVAGALLGFIGSSKRAAEEVRRLRDEFFQSQGGLEALTKKAGEAGISLSLLFSGKLKDAQLLKFEIDNIKKSLDTWDEAHQKLNAAIEKYGITVDQLGPKFKQQALDEQAVALLQDYQLLTAAGVEQNVILEKMAPNMNEYVQTAIKAGVAIPESMRPAIEKMIEMGLLTDENGVAFGSAEEAGITFAKTLTEGIEDAISAINRLVNALLGIHGVDIPVTVNGALPGSVNNPDTDNDGYGHAAGFSTPYMSEDSLRMIHKGERVEITPAALSASTNAVRGGMNATFHVENLYIGEGMSPSGAGQAFVDAMNQAILANAENVVGNLRLKLDSR